MDGKQSIKDAATLLLAERGRETEHRPASASGSRT
jgi:hypothetical protein